MARIFTKELLLNPNTDSFKKSINDMRYNAASENRKQWATGIYDVAKSLGDVGKAFYENKQRQDRLASVDDTDLEYRNDPVWIAAKDEYARTGDSSKLNAVKAQFVAEAQAKAKQDEIDAMKAKANQDAIEAAQLEYTQNMGSYDGTGDIRYMNDAQKAALKLKQLGAEVNKYIPETTSSEYKYKFQEDAAKKARAEQEAAEEKAFEKDFNERWEAAGKIGEAREKEYQEEQKKKKADAEYEIKEFDKQVEAARKIKNLNTRRNKLYELSEDRKILMNLSKKYNTNIPTIINADEYTAPKKPVANESTRTIDTSQFVLPKGFHWAKTIDGWYMIARDE